MEQVTGPMCLCVRCAEYIRMVELFGKISWLEIFVQMPRFVHIMESWKTNNNRTATSAISSTWNSYGIISLDKLCFYLVNSYTNSSCWNIIAMFSVLKRTCIIGQWSSLMNPNAAITAALNPRCLLPIPLHPWRLTSSQTSKLHSHDITWKIGDTVPTVI